MVSLKVLTPVVPEGIRRKHDLWISLELHILHNKCPLVFLLLLDFSVPLYTLIEVSIRNALFLEGTAPSNRMLSICPQWIHKIRVIFPYQDRPVLLDILILPCIFHLIINFFNYLIYIYYFVSIVICKNIR